MELGHQEPDPEAEQGKSKHCYNEHNSLWGGEK